MISLKDSRKDYPFDYDGAIDGNELQLDWYLNYQEELDREYYERNFSGYSDNESLGTLVSIIGALVCNVFDKSINFINK